MAPSKSCKSSIGRPGESQRSIAATVGWMLSTLTTLVAMLAVVGLQIAALRLVENKHLFVLSRLLLFAAAVSGLVSLVLLIVTWRVREDAPPRSIVIASIAIAATPLIGLVLVFTRGT
jgi:hypothetical protein